MPKTQSALLEAMAERQVTVDGVTRPVPEPFLVLATENPIEHEGTFPLPEAQLDRFFVQTVLGYPTVDQEIEIVREQRAQSSAGRPQAGRLRSTRLPRSSAALEDVYVDELILRWIVELVDGDPRARLGRARARRCARASRSSERPAPGR